jgi:serpin B
MAYAGAAGTTQSELASSLHLPKGNSQAQIHQAMNSLRGTWKASNKKQGFRLHLANRCWGQAGFEFQPEFMKVTREQYGAELARLDFPKDPEAARRTINQWVESQTENKIQDLIPSAGPLASARLVLTNAVYFKGDWSEPFDTKRTKDAEFHISPTQRIKTPMMYQQDDFRYAAMDGVQILELRYGDGSLSMIVLLPEKVDGLADFESKLDLELLKQWTGRVRQQSVEVFLPKFRSTSQFELADALESLGMKSPFDASLADFSGITGGKDLFLSAVIHKAFVEVNEEGTEAAAATAALLAPAAAVQEPPKPAVFRADHPFVFLIRDNRNGSVLFMGRVTDPSPPGTGT